jgi:hypothetical protein
MTLDPLRVCHNAVLVVRNVLLCTYSPVCVLPSAGSELSPADHMLGLPMVFPHRSARLEGVQYV